MARVATVSAVLLLALVQLAMSKSVEEFFPDVKGNLTKVKWSHATNSQALLEAALKGDVMMIEADVIMGNLTYANGTVIDAAAPLLPIMGHSPNTTGDLSLDSFLKQIIGNNTKGIKLDFKSIDAFKNSVPVLKALGNLTVPLWINADILKGPVNATDADAKPVDAKEFLKEARDFPQALLSIGWTTRLEDVTQNATTGKYTTDHINEMVKAIQDSKVNQSVTYPVRACYAANDVDVLQKLLSSTTANKPTLTIWSSAGDKVDPVKLSALIKTVGLDKVFVDVPESLWQQLNLANSAFTAKSSLSVLIASMLIALSAFKLL